MQVRFFSLVCVVLIWCGVCGAASNETVFAKTASSASSSGTQSESSSQSSESRASASQSLSVVSGIEAAISCWSEWDAYSTSSTNCPKTTITGSTATYTSSGKTTIQETFKLCDGHPRAVATGGERTSISPGAEISGTPQTTYTMIFPPSGVPVATETTVFMETTTYMETSCVSSVPAPKCSVGNEDCKELISSWTAGGYSKLRPPCNYVVTGDPCNNCNIYIPSVKLIYFPVTMTGDFCEDDYSTATPTPIANVSTPTTVVVSGTTFTTGSVYLSYDGVTAFGGSGELCGTPKPSGVLPLPTASLSSYRGHAAAMDIAGDIHWPFNLGDLAPNPVPWDAWISAELCYNHQDYASCQTITQEAYRPFIVYPTAFWHLDSRWKNCVSGAFGIMDPPTALPQAQEVVMPTRPKGAVEETKSVVPKIGVSKHGPRVTDGPSKGHETGATGEHGATRKNSSGPDHRKEISSETKSAVDAADPKTSRHGPGEPINTDSELTREGPRPTQTGNPKHAEQGPSTGHSAVYSDGAQPTPDNKPKSSAPFTISEHPYTAYPDGRIVGNGTTTQIPSHAPVTIDGQDVRMSQSRIWIGKSSVAFTGRPHDSSPSSTDHHQAKETFAVTWKHGTSHVTKTGHIDSLGHTIVNVGPSTLTYHGQSLTMDGMRYSVVGTPTDSGLPSRLPDIVSAGGSSTTASSASKATSSDASSEVSSTSVGLRGFPRMGLVAILSVSLLVMI